MQISVRTRTLGTPQTNSRTGKVLTNILGEPVFTQYIKGAETQERIRAHMIRYLKDVIPLWQTKDSDELFALHACIDIDEKKQLNNDPFPRSWSDRIALVKTYLWAGERNYSNDLTTGVVDDFNTIIGQLYSNTGATPSQIDEMRIQLNDYDTQVFRNQLNPELFKL